MKNVKVMITLSTNKTVELNNVTDLIMQDGCLQLTFKDASVLIYAAGYWLVASYQ